MTSDMNRRWKFAALSTAALAVVAATAHSGTDSLLYVIDFEGLAENTAISNQYEEFGVTFAIEGRPDLFPIITLAGTPIASAFFSANGADASMSSGTAGLTDPPVGGGNYFVPNDIRIQFDPPVTLVSFYVIDIDGVAPDGDVVTVTAFDGAAVVDSTTVVGTLVNDGKSVKVTLAGSSITSVLVDVTPNATTGLIGWALDFVSVARPCPSPQCTPRFRLSQESAPGAGDFGRNILGEVPLWSAVGTSAAAFYGYGVPESASWNGAALSLEADRSHLFGAVTADEVTLFIVHDRAEPDNPDGGSAEMKIEALDDASQAAFLVQDDPNISESTDFYTGLPGSGLFTARQNGASAAATASRSASSSAASP